MNIGFVFTKKELTELNRVGPNDIFGSRVLSRQRLADLEVSIDINLVQNRSEYVKDVYLNEDGRTKLAMLRPVDQSKILQEIKLNSMPYACDILKSENVLNGISSMKYMESKQLIHEILRYIREFHQELHNKKTVRYVIIAKRELSNCTVAGKTPKSIKDLVKMLIPSVEYAQLILWSSQFALYKSVYDVQTDSWTPLYGSWKMGGEDLVV